MNTDAIAVPMEKETNKDAAWASARTPLTKEALQEFATDIERLFRINPHLEFSTFEKVGENRFRMEGRNISQMPAFEFSTTMRIEFHPDGINIHYDDGIKTRTEITIEPSELDNGEKGSLLTVTDNYKNVDEQSEFLTQVDKSLITWVGEIQRYLMLWHRWSKFAWWRWYMRRVWMPMKPSGRRITYMLIWITIVEIALIILGAGIYIVEYR